MFFLAGKKEFKQLNWEDRDLLFAISKQLGNFVSLHEANDKLAESKQFDAFNRMSAFLVHDLKNVQAQLALISTNAKKHGDNPEFIADVFETVESATERLSKVDAQGGAILKKVTEQRFSIQYQENITLDESLNNQLVQCSMFCQKQGWIIDIEEYRQTPTVYPELTLDLTLFDSNSIRTVSYTHLRAHET